MWHIPETHFFERGCTQKTPHGLGKGLGLARIGTMPILREVIATSPNQKDRTETCSTSNDIEANLQTNTDNHGNSANMEGHKTAKGQTMSRHPKRKGTA